MSYETITSRQNKIAKEAAQIASSAELRREKRQFLTEGARLSEDAAMTARDSGSIKIMRAFFTDEAQKKYSKYLETIFEVAEESYLVEEHVAKLLSSTKNSQGVFCLCEYGDEYSDISTFSNKLIVLENIQDPSNLGAIMRTAEALGIDSLVMLGEGCDVYSPKALRASMGATFRMKISRIGDSLSGVKELRKHGYSTYAAVIENFTDTLGKFSFAKKSAVLIGNEGNGLQTETINACEYKITIPMAGRAESLNVGNAASILMWELCKPK